MIKKLKINNKSFINVPANKESLLAIGLNKAEAIIEINKAENFTKIKALNTQKQKELSSLSATAKKGVIIDCDKESEDNIKTALLALDDGEETLWLTVDNKPIKLKKEDLKNALRDVGIKKREIVFKYRALKDELLNG